MDLPGPHSRSSGASRAPLGGLKLMLAILIVFALLAAYGAWQHHRRPQTETYRILPASGVPASDGADH